MARRGSDGQATVEWIGVVSLLGALFVVLVAFAPAFVPGVGLARTLAAELVCAVRLSTSCAGEPAMLTSAYGSEVAAEVRDHAPQIVYEPGSSALPVDFRECRGPMCGNGPRAGAVRRSNTGIPAAAFVHVVDCRPDAIAATQNAGYDCSDARAGNLYIQYWLYYENSTSLRDVPGSPGFHEDDWESFQVRISPTGTDARASSHHGYNYDGGAGSWLSDAGIVRRSAWGTATGIEYVSGGSHAGHVHEAHPASPVRFTPAGALRLIPVEALVPGDRRAGFAITPPWRKPVYRDPEGQGT